MPTYWLNYRRPYVSGLVPPNLIYEFGKPTDEEAEKFAEQFIKDNKLNPKEAFLVKVVRDGFSKN